MPADATLKGEMNFAAGVAAAAAAGLWRDGFQLQVLLRP